MLQILFIVWRESVEALLVIGIVYSWLIQLESTVRRQGMLFLYAGVAIGLIAATLLGILLLDMNAWLSNNGQDILQVVMTFVAAVMIVYMVYWMRKNGRTLKKGMHHTLSQNIHAKRWGIAITLVTALAIAREGSETVIFIYALGFGQHGAVTVPMLLTLMSGFILAGLTFYLFQLGGRLFSWRYFFKITEILLLLLAAGLITTCVDHLISLDLLPTLKDRIWDSSFLLSDSSTVGNIVANLSGYRAQPSLMNVLIYSGYWLIIYLWFKKRKAIN